VRDYSQGHYHEIRFRYLPGLMNLLPLDPLYLANAKEIAYFSQISRRHHHIRMAEDDASLILVKLAIAPERDRNS
jgi:hypothetical protein